MWTKSFQSGVVPQEYKIQRITPIFKKGQKTKAENFRPVSLTAHSIKIFERILRAKLTHYFESNCLLNPNQHGFRQQRSCATQLISHTNNVFSNLVEGNDVDCIYLDYAKAFDKVDHNILIRKLKLYGVTEKYLTWITSFLKGRSQTVVLNGINSYSSSVKSGVPQGTVLGPLLFIVYINDLSNLINNDTKILTFADDTKIISKISNVSDYENLQKNLNSIIEWSSVNNMELNNKKFELICHKTKQTNNNLELLQSLPFHNQHTTYTTSDSTIISPSPKVRDLGIIIDSNLNWELHIQNVCQKSKQLCAWILSVFYTRDKCTMMILFNSLVRSKIEYCNEVWSPYKIKDINKVEQIQRSFTSRIKGMNELNYWERLEKLEILSLQRRRERNIILHIWKIKNKINPNSINIEFKLHARSSAIRALIKPLPKIKGKLLTQYDESFVIKSARLWNVLPPRLTHVNNVDVFKSGLKEFLFEVPDKPPIAGYPYTSDNSLVNWHVYLR